MAVWIAAVIQEVRDAGITKELSTDYADFRRLIRLESRKRPSLLGRSIFGIRHLDLIRIRASNVVIFPNACSIRGAMVGRDRRARQMLLNLETSRNAA
jgi:hypothetical protein